MFPGEVLAAIPGGGSVMVPDNQLQNGQGVKHLAWWDADGVPRASIAVEEERSWAVSASGNVLVLDRDRGAARWYDRVGAPITGEFTVAPPGYFFSLLPIAGGGIAARVDGAPSPFVFPDGEPTTAAPAAWVDRYPASYPIQIVRGGRVNAVLRTDYRTGWCATTLDLVARSGELCGTLELPAEPGACTRVTIGLDGTVFTSWQTSEHCAYRWWPKLLR